VSPFPKLSVLRHRREFLAIAEKGRSFAMPGLVLQVGVLGKEPSLRFGLTASSRVGNAVIRNRARRRLRALAQEVLPLHAAPGHDYVLIARAKTAKREYADLRQDLITALRKSGAWR
jgi:ribonuclease P protein component